MHSRRRFTVLASMLAQLALVASVAHAAPKDKAAQKLQRDAMDNDYLATNFTEAEKKLKAAAKLCGTDKCSPKVLASIQRDLGVVYIGGENKKDDGKAAFLAAFAADASIGLEKDLTTPDIQKAFDDAKKKAAKGDKGKATDDEEAAEEEEEKPKPKKPVKPAKPETPSDLDHTPATEQAVLTPVPIFVKIPDDLSVAKVYVNYKPFGSGEWKKLEMKKLGDGYGVEVPCLDIGSTTGDLVYYVVALDAENDPIATAGSKANPVKVPIKNELAGDPPHLPGKPPAAQCDDPNACPPGFPCAKGKKGKKGGKGWGAGCDADAECAEGLMCKNGSCEEGKKGADASVELGAMLESKPCETDVDCGEGGKCGSDMKCESTGGGLKNLVSFSAEQDIAFVSGTEVCSGAKNGFTCFRDDKTQYFGTPDPQKGDGIAGGAALATTRLLVGYDRAVSSAITVGARAGLALRGGPAPEGGNKFLPLHLEARASYWLKGIGGLGLHPYVFAGGGLGQVDAKVSVPVQELGCSQGSPTLPDGTYPVYDGNGNTIQSNPCTQNLDAWKKMGQSFVAAGGGVFYGTSAKGGLTGGVKLMVLFPDSGTVVAPELGYVVGF